MEIRVQTRERRDERPAPLAAERPAPRSRDVLAAFDEARSFANSCLPSFRDAENTTGKWLLYLGLAVPTAAVPLFGAIAMYKALNPCGPPFTDSPFGMAAFTFAYMSLVPIAIAWLTSFGFALGLELLRGKARGRVREALVCPYCRDEVSRKGTVVCARPRCGALYHRECWEECARQYGGCAVYGCSSKRSKEVSAAGYLVRVARLMVAATLFPPRVARALTSYQGEGFSAIFRQALERTREWLPTLARPNGREFRKAVVGLVTLACVLWLVALPFMVAAKASPLSGMGILLVLIVVLGLLPLLLALPLAVLPTIVFFTLTGIAAIFAGELAALVRADEGGTTVIGRLRLGLGKK